MYKSLDKLVKLGYTTTTFKVGYTSAICKTCKYVGIVFSIVNPLHTKLLSLKIYKKNTGEKSK